MTFVALSIPDWPTGAAANDLLAQLLAVAPRAAIAPGEALAWLDARGLDATALTQRAREALAEIGVTEVFAGAAKVPCVAAIVAREQERRETRLSVVPSGAERSFLAALPLGVLGISATLYTLLHAVGITSCGDLARLSRESVEVRFGREGLAAWRFARADDRRPIFSSRPRELPNASLDWSEFSTTDLEQLVFVLNALLKTVCDTIAAEGSGVRSLTLTLALENRTTITQSVGAARSTAQRTTWIRLMRRALERITLPDRVTGIAVQVDATGEPAVRQGDLFDLGFASEHAAESAVAHVMELQHDAVVRLERSGHPLPERRARWVAELQAWSPEPGARREPSAEPGAQGPEERSSSRLTPQGSAHDSGRALGFGLPTDTPAALEPMLLPTPREITVLTTTRCGRTVPVRYTDNAVPFPLVECLGPHCVSGESWAAPFAREYHHGVRADGTVVLLYRDVLTDRWYLAGWWD